MDVHDMTGLVRRYVRKAICGAACTLYVASRCGMHEEQPRKLKLPGIIKGCVVHHIRQMGSICCNGLPNAPYHHRLAQSGAKDA